MLKSNFGSHIQSSHVWTDHKKPAVLVHFLFIMEQDKEVIPEAVDLCTMLLLLKSVQMVTPPPSLQTLLLHSLGAIDFTTVGLALLATQAPLEVRISYSYLRLNLSC